MEIIQLLFIKYKICTFEKKKTTHFNTKHTATVLKYSNIPKWVFLYSQYIYIYSLSTPNASKVLIKISQYNTQENFQLSYSEGLDSNMDYYLCTTSVVHITIENFNYIQPFCTSAAVQDPYGFAYTWINITNSFWLDATSQEAAQHLLKYSSLVWVPLKAFLSPFFSRDKSCILWWHFSWHQCFILCAKCTSKNWWIHYEGLEE